MTAFQKESGIAKGRGFGSVDTVPSFLNRLKTWIVKDAASGGPGWYIIDDQSDSFTNPYIVCSDVAAPTNANKGKVIQFLLRSSASDVIEILFWFWWNVSTHTGTMNYTTNTLSTQENVEYGYDFRGGPDCLLLMTFASASWDWVLIDEWEGDDNLVEPASIQGTLSADYVVETGDNNNQLSNYYRLTGIGPNLDVNGKLYFSIVVSGGNSQIFIYKDVDRTLLIGQTSNASTVGSDVTVTAQNSSGLGGSIRRTAIVSNDSDIEVDFRLQLGSGEAASFSVNKFYYIWDMVNGTRLSYVKVLAITGDYLTVEGINDIQFSTGAVISPYGHRWFTWGSQVTGSSANTANPQIPYHSYFNSNPSYGSLSDGAASNTGAGLTFLNTLLATIDPDDEGKYAVMRPIVIEYVDRNGSTQTVITNRAYGLLKHVYVSSSNGLSQMLSGRTIQSKNYLTWYINSTIAYMFLDTTSLS